MYIVNLLTWTADRQGIVWVYSLQKNHQATVRTGYTLALRQNVHATFYATHVLPLLGKNSVYQEKLECTEGR